MWLWMSLLNNSKCQHFTISLLDEGLLVKQVLLVLNFKLSAKILLDAGSKRKFYLVQSLSAALKRKQLFLFVPLLHISQKFLYSAPEQGSTNQCVDGLETSLTTKTLLTYQALVFHYLLEQRPHLWHQMMPPQLI